MAQRKFEYASQELWDRVDEILARPDQMTKALRQGLSWATSGLGEKAVFYWPVKDQVRVEGYMRPKGSRSDAILVDNMHRAINTGRTDLEEVHQFLVDMFGERARHAWDEPWRVLDEAVSGYGGRLSRPRKNEGDATP